jgi:hypothetical protein
MLWICEIIKGPSDKMSQPRIKSFVQASGIDIPNVELPAGEHIVRVDVKDSDDRIGATSFVPKVEPWPACLQPVHSAFRRMHPSH